MHVACIPVSKVPTAEEKTWKKPVFREAATYYLLTARLERDGSALATAAILCGNDTTALAMPSQHRTFAILQHIATSYMPQRRVVYADMLLR